MACEYCEQGCTLCTTTIHLFSNLPFATLEQLTKLSRHWIYEAGESLFYEGDPVHSLYILHSGRVKLHRYDPEGKETIFDILVQNDAIGEDLFLKQSHYPYSATCLTETWVCEITKGDFETLLRTEPGAALNLVSTLSERLRQANERVEILSENDATRRLATFLYYQSLRLSDRMIELSIEDIAGSINLRRETVSRKIQELHKRGLITRCGQSKLRIEDHDRLHQLAREAKGGEE